MNKNQPTKGSLSSYFLNPRNATHRQYEALRARFVEGLPYKECADRFGYSESTFGVMVHEFMKHPEVEFFVSRKKGRKKDSKKDRIRELVIQMRKENLSIYDIHKALKAKKISYSAQSINLVLQEEGFSKLPRRPADELPSGTKPVVAEVADARELDLNPRKFSTQFGGIWLFLKYLVGINFDAILKKAGFPGTDMVGAGHAMMSLLATKLFGQARHSHVMNSVCDQGLGLFAGLNVIPKRSFLQEYSCRIDPRSFVSVMTSWFEAMNSQGLQRGDSFDLDFHTISFFGDDAMLQKHYVPRRSQRRLGVLTFLVQDAKSGVFCYADATVRKEDQAEQVLKFVRFWKERTGELPRELVFDSKVTTHETLNEINRLGIDFITLRTRSKKVMAEVESHPLSAWHRIELPSVTREYRTPRILEKKINLPGYDGEIRQLAITDLGHEEPTILITNQAKKSAAKLISRYACRMIIENKISDNIDFFHMDALSSSVPMKVDCDIQLSLMGSSLYRLLGQDVGNGYETAESRHIFRDLITGGSTIDIDEDGIRVRFHKRAHNPLLLAAGFGELDLRVPWLGNKRVSFEFG